MYLFLKFSYEKIKDSTQVEFQEKYGSLFDEFKHDKGFISSIFYVFYLIRRLQFLITQVYFNSMPTFQVSLNIGISFLLLVYLVFYRPFKEKSVNVSYITAEFCLICNFCIILLIVRDFKLIKIEQLEFGFISSVYFSMMIQTVVVLFNYYLSLKEIMKKFRKKAKIGIEGKNNNLK